jgi:hypothetical protein
MLAASAAEIRVVAWSVVSVEYIAFIHSVRLSVVII